MENDFYKVDTSIFTQEDSDFVTYESVKNITPNEYFKGSQFAIASFENKYLNVVLGEKTPAQVFKRVADYIASAEKTKKLKDYWSKRWFHEMWTNQWMPGGSILEGAAHPYKVSLSNCTTLGFNGDSLESIFQTKFYASKCAAYRQGLGIQFDLRPEGMEVHNASKVSLGNTHWMDYVNSLGKYIGQKGRIPAMLFSIADNNPDLLKFITVKNDETTIDNANISVHWSDKFMKLLRDKPDSMWEMKYVSETGETLSRKEKVSKIFDMFVENNWEKAEPGAQFIDIAKKYSNSDYLGHDAYKIKSTNACIPEYSKLLTPEGIRELKDLKVGDLIWSGQQWTKIKRKWETGIKPVYEFYTTTSNFKGTEDHLIFQQGKRIEVGKAKSIDWNVGTSTEKININLQDVVDGLVIGDGSVHKASGNKVYLIVGEKDKDYFIDPIKEKFLTPTSIKKGTGWIVNTTISSDELPYTYKREVPERFLKADTATKVGFLRGLYSANGSISGKKVCLSQTSYRLIRQVQLMLSSIGIPSNIVTSKPRKIIWGNGTYISKKSYELIISTGRNLFKEKIGFIQEYKKEALSYMCSIRKPSKGQKLASEIKEKIFIGYEPVWDIEVEASEHSFWCEGALVSNCSEQYLEFSDGEEKTAGLCVLASTNFGILPTDVEQAKSILQNHIAPSVNRFLDNVVTKELEDKRYAIEGQKNSLENLRRTGAGVTNLDGYLIRHGLAYDSDKGIDLIFSLMDNFNLGLYKSSISLGEEKGNFKLFDRDKFIKAPFVKQMMDRHGLEFKTMRNVTTSSIAPTGTLSLMFANPYPIISYGIEPVSGFYWWKRSRTSGEYKWYFIVPFFVRDLLKAKGIDLEKEFGLHGDSIEDQDGEIGKKIIPIIEANFPKDRLKPAHEIDPFKKIELMSKLTKYCVDSSISVTYNLPEDVPKKVVKDIYIQAWEAEVKSVSIYRDKSKAGVIEYVPPVEAEQRFKDHLTTHEAEDVSEIHVNKAPERPDSLHGKVYHVKVKGEDWIVIIGLYYTKPYEIFAGKADKINLSKRTEAGRVEKVKKNFYFYPENTDDKISLTKDFMDDEVHSALSRQISLNLRHGTPIEEIVDHLEKAEGTIVDISKVMARVLKKFIDIQKLNGERKCAECGSKDLDFVEGCFVCKSCGYGKCG